MPGEAIVVPAFNDLCGGTPVNDVRTKFLGPLLADEVLRLDRARLHLLDGTDLGALPSLKVNARFRWQDYRQ
jgi:metallophosphoesterase superfamily enzyme